MGKKGGAARAASLSKKRRTDAPFGSATGIATGITKLGLSDSDLAAIQRNNALRLFPHFT
jgi:hypothetical protein